MVEQRVAPASEPLELRDDEPALRRLPGPAARLLRLLPGRLDTDVCSGRRSCERATAAAVAASSSSETADASPTVVVTAAASPVSLASMSP
jgi:hypothetical protein